MKNSDHGRQKNSSVEHKMNEFILWIILFQLACCVICAVGCFITCRISNNTSLSMFEIEETTCIK